MTGQLDAFITQFLYQLMDVGGHGLFIITAFGLIGFANASQVGSDDGKVFGKLWEQPVPHIPVLSEAMYQYQGFSFPADDIMDLYSINFDDLMFEIGSGIVRLAQHHQS